MLLKGKHVLLIIAIYIILDDAIIGIIIFHVLTYHKKNDVFNDINDTNFAMMQSHVLHHHIRFFFFKCILQTNLHPQKWQFVFYNSFIQTVSKIWDNSCKALQITDTTCSPLTFVQSTVELLSLELQWLEHPGCLGPFFLSLCSNLNTIQPR